MNLRAYDQLNLEGWDREDGREAQGRGDMGTYVCV